METRLKIDGMTCAGCGKTIKKQVSALKGVKRVEVDHKSGEGTVAYDKKTASIQEIISAINSRGYACSVKGQGTPNKTRQVIMLLAAAAALFGAYLILKNNPNLQIPEIGLETSVTLIFAVGLFTGFHCIAMCGGFMVSYSANEAKKGIQNIRSHLAYGLGKTISYTAIGALFGLAGSVVAFTPALRGIAAVLAGLFLMLYGLNMLGILRWFNRVSLKTPSFIKKITGKISRKNSSPLTIGLLNGLMIACGPLQAMYLLAAASGSAYRGALYLFAFGLGTLPALFAFGVAATMLRGLATRRILKFSGVVVILLGLVMLNRGLSLSGAGFDLNTLLSPASVAGKTVQKNETPANVVSGPRYQEIQMNVTRYGWTPNQFVLKKGVPVRWVINGLEVTGCNRAIQVPKFGLKFDVKPGLQTIEFTPAEAGTVPWSCWMGMIPGTFIVEDDIINTNTNP